ncbi:MAG TPA: hypothetical protein VJV78_07205 [Polyangiales bacterium]|nr:hypothetical protein [Polyangiales bacterium]
MGCRLWASALFALYSSCASDTGVEPDASATSEHFSFFVASYAAMQRLSGSQSGFGGDLRHGEQDGLTGADKICREIAEGSLAGSGKKTWRAFLSATKGANGQPVHAIDRIGEGPWYDRRGRLLAMTKADLLHDRPAGADPAIADDLPNEDGVPNHAPDGTEVDNHDILTGTGDDGRLFGSDWSATCHDWTSSVGSDGKPRVGHSWPRDFSMIFGDGGFPPGFPFGDGGMPPFPIPDGGMPPFPFPDGGFPPGFPPGFDPSQLGSIDGVNWMSSLNEAGCAPGASLVEMGPPNPSNPTVGSGGGYGGIYCFALTP